MTKFIKRIIVFVLTLIEIFEFPLNINSCKFEFDLLSEINNQRIMCGTDGLKLSNELCSAASIRAEEISEKWSHERTDGTKFDVLIQNAEWTIAGENLAKFSGEASNKTILSAWLDSEKHQKNLLNPKFTQCGIGKFISNDIYYVALILSD